MGTYVPRMGLGAGIDHGWGVVEGCAFDPYSSGGVLRARAQMIPALEVFSILIAPISLPIYCCVRLGLFDPNSDL